MKYSLVFQALVENTNDVIMVLDSTPLSEGGPKIVYVNAAFEKLMGYTAEEVVGQNPKLLQGPGTDDKTRYKIRKAMREGTSIRTQILNYDKAGNELWLDINMVPLFDEHGTLTYYAAIERDLTEHKKLQSHLENMATIDSLTREDIMQGLQKSLVFGLIIALVGVSSGFSVTGGAEGVGRATTRSVVTAISWLVIADMVFTYFQNR